MFEVGRLYIQYRPRGLGPWRTPRPAGRLLWAGRRWLLLWVRR